MRRERDAPMPLFTLVSAVSLALAPVLTQRDRVLDDAPLFQAVKADVRRRLPRTALDGRPSTPVEVLLRLRGIDHRDGWRDEAPERWGTASLVWRPCWRGSVEAVPAETPLRRGANLIPPATRPRGLDHVGGLARSLTVTHGRQRRLAGTVVAPPSHPPADRTWRDDGVRGLSRTLPTAKHVPQATPALARQGGRERTRRAKRPRTRRMAAARQRGAATAARRPTASPPRLDSTLATRRQAQPAGTRRTAPALPVGQPRAKPLGHVSPLGGQVVTHTTRRVIRSEAVPAAETRVSWCEPPTAMIRTGTPGKPPACGRVICLDAGEGGSSSRDAVLEGHAAEDAPLPPRREHPRRLCHRPPHRLAGDRGGHTTANAREAPRHGVQQVVWPTPGAKSASRLAHEPQRWFRRGRHWRAGIEGRLSGLKRRHQRDHCRDHGPGGMERWVGGGVITHQLRLLAQATGHAPEGATLQRCHGCIRGQTWLIKTCSQRASHHNLGLREAAPTGPNITQFSQ